MGSIFSLSDTIDFGHTPKSWWSAPRKTQRVSHEDMWHNHEKHVEWFKATHSGANMALQMEPTHSGQSLVNLIAFMKPSFLPKEDSGLTARHIILSPASLSDPAILVVRDDTAILLGMGAWMIHACGKEYISFPDMRLPFSVKSQLRAWILFKDEVDVPLFMTILPALDFPPIYASRRLIAFLREEIKDMDVLEKCRFFELFSVEPHTRMIGPFECGVAMGQETAVFAIRTGKTSIAYDHLPLTLTPSLHADTHCIVQNDAWKLGETALEPGDIAQINNDGISRHNFRFSLDTFYLDTSSVGVEAGFVLSDRKTLAENGVLFFALTEDPRARTIAGHIFIDSRAFVHSHEMMRVHKEILKAIRIHYETIVSANPSIESGELAQALRKEITKYCVVLTGKSPIVMPIIL